jgi:polyhydroxybutyrate depolymerase
MVAVVRHKRVGRWRHPLVGAVLASLVLVAAGTPAFVSHRSLSFDAALALDATGATGSHGVTTVASVQKAAPNTVISVRRLTVNHQVRAYVVIAPAVHTTTLPLLVVLHGVDASALLEVQRDEFLPFANDGQAILVYPIGYGESWNVGVDECCKAAAQVGVDDVAFVEAVTRAAVADEPVDPAQVHLVGFSNGGKLAFQVLCDDATPYADAAIVSAVPLAACTDATQPARPIIMTVGSSDDDLPMTGAAQPISQIFPAALAVWRQRDGCTDASTVTEQRPAAITTWADCSSGSVVIGVTYAALQHVWPTSGLVGIAASAANLIWRFQSGQLGHNQVG